MTLTTKLLTALPLALLLGGCVTNGTNEPVDSVGDLESTVDSDIDGDGTVPGPGGTPVPA